MAQDGEIIDRRSSATPETNWESLMNYPKFGELASENLSDATKQKLHDELASIDEDEAKDYSNPNQIGNRHTKEEYNQFRQNAIAKAFDKAKTPEPAPEPAPQPNVDIRPEPLAPVPDLDTPTPESDTLDDDIENLKKERDQIDAELA